MLDRRMRRQAERECGRALSPYTSECPCYFEHIKPTCNGR